MRFNSVLLFILLALSITSCKYCDLAEGVKRDSSRIFKSKKDFFKKFKIDGVIEAKRQCDNCDLNKYQIEIRLNGFKIDNINFSNRSYEPYYSFNEKELLIVSVSKKLFDLIKEQDSVIKEANSFSLKFRNYNIPILSEKASEWLPID